MRLSFDSLGCAVQKRLMVSGWKVYFLLILYCIDYFVCLSSFVSFIIVVHHDYSVPWLVHFVCF